VKRNGKGGKLFGRILDPREKTGMTQEKGGENPFPSAKKAHRGRENRRNLERGTTTYAAPARRRDQKPG